MKAHQQFGQRFLVAHQPPGAAQLAHISRDRLPARQQDDGPPFRGVRRAVHRSHMSSPIFVLFVFILLLPILFAYRYEWQDSGSYASVVPILKPTCTDKLQDRINAAHAGDTIKARTDCIYREAVVVNKSLTLDGQGGVYGVGGAEIRGSDIWGDSKWRQQGTKWVSTLAVPRFYSHGSCQGGLTDAPCHWPEQVFLDGQPLQQVSTTSATVSPGQFQLSPSRQVILADNPIGRTVEVTTRTVWLYAYANNVKVEGFTMKHAAVDAQNGAIRNYRSGDADSHQFSRMTIENNTLSDAHGDVVSFVSGYDNKLLDNDIFHGGDLGVHVSLSNPQIEGNRIHNNNTEHFSTGWEAGGVKATRVNDAVFDGNDVYGNEGPGLWCDVGCHDVRYSGNRSHDNTGIGIFFEVSDGAKIIGNTLWNNGFGFPAWAYGASIAISSSSNADVANNVVAWSAGGITIFSQCRARRADGSCDLTNPVNNVRGNYIHDNTIILLPDTPDAGNNFILGFARDIKSADGSPYMYMYSPEADNHGDSNRYWIPQPEGSTSLRFAWTRPFAHLADFNATPGGKYGAYLTDAETYRILTDAGIPTALGGNVPPPAPTAFIHHPIPISSKAPPPALSSLIDRTKQVVANIGPTIGVEEFALHNQERAEVVRRSKRCLPPGCSIICWDRDVERRPPPLHLQEGQM